MQPISLQAAVIAPVCGRLSTYPEVHLEILVETGPIDIVARIGHKEWAAVDMIAVRVVGPMKVAVVRSPEYFERRRPPRTIDDLASRSCIQYRLAQVQRHNASNACGAKLLLRQLPREALARPLRRKLMPRVGAARVEQLCCTNFFQACSATGSPAPYFEISCSHHGSATPRWCLAAQSDPPALRPAGRG